MTETEEDPLKNFDPLHDLLPSHVRPLRDNLLVEPFETTADDRTKGGIYLAQNRKAERCTLGVVLAVGPGIKVDLNVLPGTGGSVLLHEHAVHKPAIQEGDIVAYPTSNGYDVRLDDETYRMLSERDVLCIFGRDPEATRPGSPGDKIKVEFDPEQIQRDGDPGRDVGEI